MARNRRNGRSSRRNRKHKNTAKIAAAISVPVIVVGLGGFSMTHYLGIEKIDADYCYQREDQHVAAVYLDTSMKTLSTAQLRDYRTGPTEAYRNAPANTRFLFFSSAADTSGSLAKPLFTICKPPSTNAELAKISAPEIASTVLKNRAEEAEREFSVRVDDFLEGAKQDSKRAQDSAILETLREISLYPDFHGASRSLHVITDGIQNTDIARFCSVRGAMPSYPKFKARDEFKYVKPKSFEGTEVTLFLVESGTLPQPGLQYCTNAEMRRWWPAYFEDNGADSVMLRRLRFGGNS